MFRRRLFADAAARTAAFVALEFQRRRKRRARAEETFGIDGLAVDANLVMQVRPVARPLSPI